MRLFAALELPDHVVATLERWAAELGDEALRLMPPSAMHATLVFLGERPQEEVPAIGEAVVACAAPVPGLRLGSAAWLGRGSALAIDLVDGRGACTRVQACVSEALVALGAYTAEERAFRPHVTVARVKRGARVKRRVPPVPDVGEFAGTALTLYRSKLGPGGARYEPLARAAL